MKMRKTRQESASKSYTTEDLAWKVAHGQISAVWRKNEARSWEKKLRRVSGDEMWRDVER